jgi:ankyrin repeat protein
MLYTLLHAAAETRHFLVLRLILKHVGHRFSSQDAKGRTPLMIAVSHGHEQAVTTLLSYAQNMEMTAKDILIPDHRQRSVLTAAVKSKKLAIVRAILDLASKEPDLLSSKDIDGWTPLSRAAATGSTDILRLICHPGNVNEKDQIWHQQPLLWAAQHGDEEAVRLFLNDPSLSHKLDRYAKSDYGCTSLWCAVRYRQLNVVKLLLQDESPQPYLRKAWLNATDRFSDNMLSPLQMAVCSDSPEIVKLLLEEKDVEVNAQDHHGVSVFLSAVQTGNKTLVKTLAEAPAIDVNLRDHENNSALMRACKNGYLSIVKYLLDCKKMTIPIDATDNEGMSALAHACAAADPAIVQLLLDRGAQ